MKHTLPVVGVAGGTGSGKSTLVDGFVTLIGVEKVAVLPSDAYYRDRRDLSFGDRNEVNYDHPEALEIDLLVSDLARLRELFDRPADAARSPGGRSTFAATLEKAA